jgi:hypothetical protein
VKVSKKGHNIKGPNHDNTHIVKPLGVGGGVVLLEVPRDRGVLQVVVVGAAHHEEEGDHDGGEEEEGTRRKVIRLSL